MRSAVGGTQESDLGEGETELPRPDGKEHVEDVGEAIVDEVRAAGGAENSAGAAHAPDCDIDVTRALPALGLRAPQGHAGARGARHQRALLVVHVAVDQPTVRPLLTT